MAYFSQQIFLMIASIALFIACGFLALLLINRSEKIRQLSVILKKIRMSFNELDQQAKLIVKTDLELNKAQEELDKRLNALDALQKISRLISTTLDENEIYQCLNEPVLTELGFEKYLVSSFTKDKTVQTRVSFGFSKDELTTINSRLSNNIISLLYTLQKNQIISSVRKQIGKDYSQYDSIFTVKHFVISPLLIQKEPFGFIFAGNLSDAFAFTEGDEEFISILADQISQAINNARLFEEVFMARQKLELTVQERTKQLSQALDKVEKISETKSEFISAVSHELRTPLTSIKGYASILMTGKLGEIPEKVKARLAKINFHSDNLVKLINDLLDISRIESSKTQMNWIQSSLPSMVDNIHDLLYPQLKEKNITFTANFPEEMPKITMDTNQIERVFINLIGNAIKFTPEGGSITVSGDFDNEQVSVSVADTGLGINDQDIEKLFNEFYRVDNTINQNVKGSGLGLALVKKIVEAHGGKIWVKSKINKGTAFYFFLPIKHKKETGETK